MSQKSLKSVVDDFYAANDVRVFEKFSEFLLLVDKIGFNVINDASENAEKFSGNKAYSLSLSFFRLE